MVSPASDGELLARQDALQDEARELCWPDLDVMVHVGAGFSPQDALGLATMILGRALVTAAEPLSARPSWYLSR